MKRLSPKRRGLLRLLRDREPHPVYFPALRSHILEQYGLTIYDRATITWAAKAGLVRTWYSGLFGRLTPAGHAALHDDDAREKE